MTIQRLLLALLLLMSVKGSFAQSDKKYSIESLRQDFSILRGALEHSHPGIYWYHSKAEMDNSFDAAYQSLDHEMTELEYFQIIAPIISGIGCGHTWAAVTEHTQQRIWDNGRVLPLRLKFMAHKAYCVQNNSRDSTSIRTGDEILSINNFSIDSLLALSNRFSPGDGLIEVGKRRILDNVFNQFFTLYIGRPDKYLVKMKNGEGQINEIVIEPVTLNEFESISRRRYPNKKVIEADNISLSFLLDNSAALLKIKEFSDWKTKGKRIEFGNRLKNSFQKIDSSKTQNLIIDLRDNDGGNEAYGLLLFSYLTSKPFTGYKQVDFRTTHFSFRKYTTTSWLQYQLFKVLLRHKKINDTTYLLTNSEATRLHQPVKKPFMGKIYVLVNRGSFSTTSDFAALVHFNRMAIFVGEETGGSYLGNSSNYAFLMTLSNTKIRINIPVARYQTNVTSNNNFGRGTIPDYEIQYSIEDYLGGVDKEMNTVLDLIKK
jgi:C-terminal processing protease CtpA/Prc